MFAVTFAPIDRSPAMVTIFAATDVVFTTVFPTVNVDPTIALPVTSKVLELAKTYTDALPILKLVVFATTLAPTATDVVKFAEVALTLPDRFALIPNKFKREVVLPKL